MTVGLCLLTWNEIAGCKHDVPLIDRSRFEQIYCIDCGSTDGTVEYLTEQGIEVYPQTGKGLNQACKDGADNCRCDAFVFFHPKNDIAAFGIGKSRIGLVGRTRHIALCFLALYVYFFAFIDQLF